MGFPMATNLRKKIPKECTLYVNDVDKAAVERFVKEISQYGPVEVCATAKEITEKSVVPFTAITN
jgi:3-hydroxyisobutyrate/3-hydroxypropionate dehydrogenase